MKETAFINELKVAVTVCELDGTIAYMNEKSQKTFGGNLVGQDVFACHSPASVEKLKGMLASGEENCYTIEKNGVKKMIYQTPWLVDGKVNGFVELSLEIPFEMRHIVREAK